MHVVQSHLDGLPGMMLIAQTQKFHLTIIIQSGPLDFEDPRNQGSRRRGGPSAPPRSRLEVPTSKFPLPRLASF